MPPDPFADTQQWAKTTRTLFTEAVTAFLAEGFTEQQAEELVMRSWLACSAKAPVGTCDQWDSAHRPPAGAAVNTWLATWLVVVACAVAVGLWGGTIAFWWWERRKRRRHG